MKTISKALATLAIAGWASTAAAVPIEAENIVRIGEQEWLQVNLFTNTSWDTINAQCPNGTCLTSGSINGYDLGGWTWASIANVQSLFEIFTGTTNRRLEINSTWAPEMAALFNPTFNDVINHQVTGLTSTSSSTDFAYAPRFVDSAATYQYDSTLLTNNAVKSTAYSYIGAWFVRDALTVPTPATLAIFGLGLVNLGLFRRKYAGKGNFGETKGPEYLITGDQTERPRSLTP